MRSVMLAAACVLAAIPALARDPPPDPPRDLGQEVTIGGHDATVWRPAGAGAAAIVIFSHGFGACPAHSSFLTAALSGEGMLVVAPRHADSGCAGRAGMPRPEAPFRIPEVWTEDSFRGRRDDVVAILAALRTDPAFTGAIDWSRLGLMGHSLGGYTVLGLAGAWPSWRIEGVGAVVALSPSCAPFLGPAGRLDRLTAPVLFQGGTMDFGVTPFLRRKNGCYDKARAPARLLVFRGAGHFAWLDARSPPRTNIVEYTIDFFQTAFRAGAPGTLPRRHGVAEMREK